MTSPTSNAQSTGAPSDSIGRAARVLTAVAAVGAVLALGFAGWISYDAATYVPRPHEDTSLYGLAYVVSAAIAVPAGLALLLAGVAAWLGRRQKPGWALGLSITALVLVTPIVLIGTGQLLF